MKAIIKRIIFAWRYKRAVKKAIAFHKQTGRKYYVILLSGKPKVVAKKDIRLLVALHRFRRGVKVADIENRALFITK